MDAKRVFDFFFALLLSVFLFLPALFIALCISLTGRGGVLFWSKRVGHNNQIFLMPKFRTMKEKTPQLATHLLTNPTDYVTPLGAFLRQSSLDEIPQLLSILQGHMSFVGPRPALFNQYDLIEQRTKKGIHLIRPGLTGWAQINGRDLSPIPEKVEHDFYYFNNRSFLLDLKIIFLTSLSVVLKKDIVH